MHQFGDLCSVVKKNLSLEPGLERVAESLQGWSAIKVFFNYKLKQLQRNWVVLTVAVVVE